MRLITQADIVIVGSGPGGATIAKELSEHGKNVLVLEKGGEQYEIPSLAKRISKKLKKSLFLDRNLSIYRKIVLGGTSTVSSGNVARCLEKELYSLDVNIEEEFQAIEQELNVTRFPYNLMGNGAKKIWKAANSLGYNFEPIEKCIDFTKCIGCGKCNFDCPTNAKWTAINFVKKAQDNGALFLHDTTVKEVLISNGSVEGVKALSAEGIMHIRANTVVLAAGALESPIILRRTGIGSAGKMLFCDPCFLAYGPSKNDSFDSEPRSIINTEFLHKDGFSLLNCIVHSRVRNYLHNILKCKAGKGMMGIMIKIKDEPIGCVHNDGNIRKTMTSEDSRKLNASIPIAKEILQKAGVGHRYITTKAIGGYHPGGTAAIGQVVDRNLETEIKNLFVSDASVLPTSPGLPPMLTIMALSKRLAKRLIDMS